MGKRLLKRITEPIPAWEVWFIVIVFDLMQRVFNG